MQTYIFHTIWLFTWLNLVYRPHNSQTKSKWVWNWASNILKLNIPLTLSSVWQRMREEMEEITQQQLVHDKYCKEMMGFGTKPRHITPFTSFQSVQPQQSNALLGLLGYSSPQGFLSFGATPAPAKTSLVESRYCRELMEERFDQVGLTEEVSIFTECKSSFLVIANTSSVYQ